MIKVNKIRKRIKKEKTVFTIYDWKEYRPIGWDEEIEFHIGGMNIDSCEEALEELERLI